MTLKLKDDLKMYLYAKNEVARLRYSKLLMIDGICMLNGKKTQK